MPLPASPQPKILQTFCLTDANSFVLEQISKYLVISETELNPCMPQPPAQFQADVLRTPKTFPRKAACQNKSRIKLKKNQAVKPIFGRINAPRLANERYQKLQPPALTERIQRACASLTTFSPAVVATWTRAPDETLTKR